MDESDTDVSTRLLIGYGTSGAKELSMITMVSSKYPTEGPKPRTCNSTNITRIEVSFGLPRIQ